MSNTETTTTINPQTINPTIWSGIAHGFLSLLSLGDVYDPVGELNTASKNASDNIQSTFNKLTMSTINSIDQETKQLWDNIQSKNTLMQENIQYYNNLANNSIYQQSLFTKILAILIIVILFFMLIK